jgi:hypothetical protein
MAVNKWHIDLVELGPYIANKQWGSVHGQAKALNKELYAKAPTVKKSFENIVLLTMKAEISPAEEKEIEELYNSALKAADKELSTDDFDRVMKEELLADRLDVLSSHISSSFRIIWNYWWGENGGDYKEWEAILGTIETSPLTRLGRLRLLARHTTIGNRILPSFMKMVVQLWPLAAFWIIKKVGTLLISSTVSKTLEARKTKKQLKGLSEKMKSKDFSIGSLKAKPKKRKKRKRRSK